MSVWLFPVIAGVVLFLKRERMPSWRGNFWAQFQDIVKVLNFSVIRKITLLYWCLFVAYCCSACSLAQAPASTWEKPRAEETEQGNLSRPEPAQAAHTGSSGCRQAVLTWRHRGWHRKRSFAFDPRCLCIWIQTGKRLLAAWSWVGGVDTPSTSGCHSPCVRWAGCGARFPLVI